MLKKLLLLSIVIVFPLMSSVFCERIDENSLPLAANVSQPFSVANKSVIAEAKDGIVTLSRLSQLNGQETKRPFASFPLPPGSKVLQEHSVYALIYTDEAILHLYPVGNRPFLGISVYPRPGKEAKTVKSIRLPEIQLSETYAPADCKALGSAGLTEVDGHKGSYMFLSIAQPETRNGVVAAWATSYNGSGIVFSSKTEDGKNVTVQPELQYGRWERPAAEDPAKPQLPSEENRPEQFLIGQFDDCLDGLEAYADEIACQYDIQLKPQISGYCTWYSNKFGGAGTEESTKAFADAAFEKLVPFGMSYFQIDDQWQLGQRKNGPGKNFTTHNPNGPYPSGMKPTAEYLNSKGLRAGIWFMPFSGNWDDPYYADKQDWFVKSAIDYPAPGEKNTRRFSGINQSKGAPYETFWGGTSLDMTDKNVEKYVHDEVDQIANKWGYKYFKYDGMWTAMACEQLYVNDEYFPDDLGLQIFDDMSKTNVQIYRKGLKMVRAAAGDDVFILGCNVSQNMRTMGASYGLVDAMRIGPDNGSNWNGICAGPVRGTARYFYNGRVWYNDPDPVYVRDSIPLSHAQLITSWAAVSGQLFAFSDWLPELSEERVNVLQRTIAPARLYTARPLDLFQSKLANIWKVTKDRSAGSNCQAVFGLFNWDANNPMTIDKTFEQLGLDPAATYVGFDFWANAFVPPFKQRLTCEIPGGSCRILSLVKLEDKPVLVGTNRHVTSPLFEVENVRWDAEKLVLSGTSAVVANDPYELRIIAPKGLKLSDVSPTVSGPCEMIQSTETGRTIRVGFTSKDSVKVDWSIPFQKGELAIPAPQKPTGFSGKSGYSRISLQWDAAENFGLLLTKTFPDGAKKSFALTGALFTDTDVQPSASYSYRVQTKGWDGNLSEPAEIQVDMPKKIVVPPVPAEPEINIADLKPIKASCGWGSVQNGKSAAGNPLNLNGKTYQKGVGVHAAANLVYNVPADMARFVATVGLDDFHKTDNRRSVIIRVWADVCEMGEPQVLIGESPLLSNETTNVWHFDLPIEGRVKQIRLEVSDDDDGIACDHVDWVNTGFRK